MNILFVHEALGSHGGAESNVWTTASELRARGYRVGILTQRATRRDEVGWHELFGTDVFWLNDGTADALAQFEPDVVYVHKWDDLTSLEALLASGVPLVRMVHDHDLYCLRSYRYHPLTRKPCTRAAGAACAVPCLAPLKRSRTGKLPIRWASLGDKLRELAFCRRFDRTLVATEFMRGELLINGFHPRGIEVVPVVPRPADPLRSAFSDRNRILFAGQITRGKGVDVLLRALAKVRANFEAVIVGDGHYRGRCEKLARKLGLESRVHFAGFVPQPDLKTLYRDTSVSVVPSVWPEPMGLVGLEAMRYALPVVAFDVGGISAWLRHEENGFLVPWMDTGEFARRIDQLLADKMLARTMGQRGSERAERDFNFDDYIASVERVFAQVATRSRQLCAA